MSRATVARSVKRLHELGIIAKEPGGKGRSNSYYPAFAPRETVSPATLQQSHQRDQVSLTAEPQSYYSSPEQQAKGMSNSNPSSGGAAPGGARPAAGAPGGGDHPEFAAFFAAYPKREGRVAASQAYSAAMGGGTVTPGELLAAAKAYGAAKQHITDPKYIKMPANWLRDQCWLEDPQPPRQKEPVSLRGGAAGKHGAGKHGAKNMRKRARHKGKKNVRKRADHTRAQVMPFKAKVTGPNMREQMRFAPSQGLANVNLIGQIELLHKTGGKIGDIWYRYPATGEVAKTTYAKLTDVTVDAIIRQVELHGMPEAVAKERLRGVKYLENWSDAQLQAEVENAKKRLPNFG